MKTFTSKTLIYCCQLMIAGSICYAEPENIDFKIQVFRTPSKIGSHFQEKLLDHSTTANAIEKMPLLIQKGQARLEMEFEKTLPEKSPSKLNSTNGKFTSDDDVDHELGFHLLPLDPASKLILPRLELPHTAATTGKGIEVKAVPAALRFIIEQERRAIIRRKE